MRSLASVVIAFAAGAAIAYGWHVWSTKEVAKRHEESLRSVAEARDAERANAEESAQRQARLEQDNKKLAIEVEETREAVQAENGFARVASDYGIGNGAELRQRLKSIPSVSLAAWASFIPCVSIASITRRRRSAWASDE